MLGTASPEVFQGSLRRLHESHPRGRGTQNTCIDRLEKARALAEREHSLSSLWTLLLGVAGGISTAVAIVSATEPVRRRLGLAPVIVAVSVSALAAIAAPIAVNQDKAGLAVAQYEVLSQALEFRSEEHTSELQS